MKNLPLVILAILLAQTTIAQQLIEPCKYGQPLIDALQNDYTPDATLGYGPARDILYSEIDNIGNDLYCIYSLFSVTLDPNADPSVSAYQNGAGINAEHVYPQSLGAGNEPAKSDLHNIFPSQVDVNSSRGSCPFGEIDDADTEKWFYMGTVLNSIPTSDIDLYSEKDEEDCVFEPREAVKGDIARAVFYFYAIYQSIAESESTSFFPQQKDVLYQWHLDDPADAVETDRNMEIAMRQGNDNPFILDPSLAYRAYFVDDASWPEGDPNCYTTAVVAPEESALQLASNFVSEELLVLANDATGDMVLSDIRGNIVRKEKLNGATRMDVSDLPQGIYLLFVATKNTRKTFRVFKW